MTPEQEEIEILKRMLARERKARKEAEHTLESKAQDLYESHEAMRLINAGLEEVVKQRAEELRQSELRFQSIIEKATDIIYKCDARGNFTYVNPTGVQKLGYTEDDIEFVHFSDLVVPEHKQKLIEFYAQQYNERLTETYQEFPVKTKNGLVIWIGQNVFFHFDSFGELSYVSAVARDISETVISRNRLNNLIASLQSAVLLEDENRKIVLTNVRFTQMFGVPVAPEYLVGADCSNSAEESKHHFEDEKGFILRIAEIISTKEKVLGDKLVMKNGMILERDYIPIYIDNQYSGHLWNYRDVTDKQKALEKIKYSEEKYRNIIANMNLGLTEVDLEDRIITANNMFCEISGYRLSEMIGKCASDLLLDDEAKEAMSLKTVERTQGISDAYEMEVVVKSGERRWWLISGAPAYDQNGTQTGSIGIHLDITNQKKLAEELLEAKAQAEASSSAKELFLANMSHEIRTPMNGIMGLLRQLSKSNLNEKDRRYLDNIHVAADHLMSILNDILDMSKIEAGKLEIEVIPFNITETIGRVVNILSTRVEEKSIIIQTEIDERIDQLLLGDSHRLNQLLINLAGNSVKFTDQGKVKIQARLFSENEKSQRIYFAVTDTGIGMDKSFIDKIFDKFIQEDRSITRKYGGTGLGMSISRELIELMGGKMHIESVKGIGTKISFELTFDKSNENKDESFIETTLLDKAAKLSNKSILVAEDNDMNQMVVQVICDIYNINVTMANNGFEAVELSKNKTFDVILMDMQMPIMSGIDATISIRNSGINTPIIALTANVIKSDLDHCIEVGMDDYITKPFEEETFVLKLLKWMGEGVVETFSKEMKAATNSLYSLEKLKALSRGKNDFVIRMVEMFLYRAPEAMEQIEESLAAKNFETVAYHAHKVKPIFDNLGAPQIMEMLAKVELIAKDTCDEDQITELIEKIKLQLKTILPSLRNDLEQIGK
ncbi:MAG: PAS domain S-box protein [Salibacteraceae bacterium]|nr:PAS domain S-box protein [Salibacteraceae bacterium]